MPEDVTDDVLRNFITSSSKGLAELTRSKPTVQFIHESVRDFLLKKGGFHELSRGVGQTLVNTSHTLLRDSCQSYLCSNQFQLTASGENFVSGQETNGARQELKANFPLLEYASQNVLYHADKAMGAIGAASFVDEFDLKTWINTRNMLERHKVRWYTSQASFLYVLASEGHENLIRHITRDGPVIGLKGER